MALCQASCGFVGSFFPRVWFKRVKKALSQFTSFSEVERAGLNNIGF